MTRYQPTRRYPRSVRVNELMREILADELERLGEERLEMVAITGVDVDADLRHAVVWFDALDDTHDDEILAAFAEVRTHLQKAIGRQSTVKHTPVLTFQADVAIRAGERIEAVLRDDAAVMKDRPQSDGEA